MNRRKFVMSALAFSSGLFADRQAEAQNSISKPDLTKLVKGKGWTVINRSASLIEGDVKKGIQFDERPEPGLAWLNGFEFANAVIEFDVKGRNVLQKSFVGVAFHGLDEKTYDAIYFRPFNFRSDDPVRHNHSVQYISHPTYTWEKLRNDYPGKYEQPITAAPDPDSWFNARIFVFSPKVSVFVNGAKEPSLVVEQLSARGMDWFLDGRKLSRCFCKSKDYSDNPFSHVGQPSLERESATDALDSIFTLCPCSDHHN